MARTTDDIITPDFPTLHSGAQVFAPNRAEAYSIAREAIALALQATGVDNSRGDVPRALLSGMEDVIHQEVGTAVYDHLASKYSFIPLKEGGPKVKVILDAMERDYSWFTAQRFKQLDARLSAKPSGRARLKEAGRLAAHLKRRAEADVDLLSDDDADDVYRAIEAENVQREKRGARRLTEAETNAKARQMAHDLLQNQVTRFQH